MNNLHIITPSFEAPAISKAIGKKIFFKMECFQPSGSFKNRGMGQLCQELVAQGKTHLVSSSGGNAGYSTAYVGKKLGVAVTVFVPTTTNPHYIEAIRFQGADVKIAGNVWDEADAKAREFLHSIEGGYVPPFDHPSIWAGNSTMIDEIVTQCPKPDAIIAAVGGGGLMNGIIEGLQRHNWLDIPLFAVETEGTASFAAAVHTGKLVALDKISGIATSLGAKRISSHLFEWSKKINITPIVVTDKDTVIACKKFLDEERVLVEPACGAALSVIYNNHPALAEAKSVLVIVCGGIGLTLEKLEEYLKAFSI